MTGMWIAAHTISILYGLAAAFVTIAVFYVAGLVLLPRRWHDAARWPDSVVLGLACYVIACWIASTSRNIALIYVMLAFGVALWGAIALRFRWLQSVVGSPLKHAGVRLWLLTFTVLYVFAYVLVRPPAAPLLLAIAPDGSADLITYARYAKHVFVFGTANVDLATFDYRHSPAAIYLLAWHALPFVGDPLDAAMPALFMVAALFGMMAVDFAGSVFRLSPRGAMAIGGIGVCAPLFRWALSTYSLGELLSATVVLYLTGVVGRSIGARRVTVPEAAGVVAAGVLLFLGAFASIGDIASGVAEVARAFSPLAVFGLPSRLPSAQHAREGLRAAAIVVLPFAPVCWAAAAYALRGSPAIDRIAASPVDRQLVRALVVYVGAAVIIGNVAVEAFRSPGRQRWPGAWRQMAQIGRVPFRAVTLKVADQPNGLSTALSMYYMPGRKADVIGRGVRLEALPFDTVTRQQPMFIHNFGCEGVGHQDTVSVPEIGCLLMAPPSMTVGTSYPFNRTFLFLQYDRMSARDPGGRWNTDPTLNVRVTADPQRASLDREMFINFLVNPFLKPGATPLALIVRWGKDRRGQVVVSDRQWLSVPVASSDWSGNRLWSVPIAIDFPDGRTILFHEVALTESPRGAVVQAPRAPR